MSKLTARRLTEDLRQRRLLSFAPRCYCSLRSQHKRRFFRAALSTGPLQTEAVKRSRER